MFDSYCLNHAVISGLPAPHYRAVIKKYLDLLGIKENLLSVRKGITKCRDLYGHELVEIKRSICVVFYDQLKLTDKEISSITGIERTTVLHHRHCGYDMLDIKDSQFLEYYHKLLDLI